MKGLLMTLLLVNTLWALTPVNAQGIRIHGKVSNGNEALPGATVTLRSFKDSLLITGTVTNTSGIYELNGIDTGRYLISISDIGYFPFIKAISVKDSFPQLLNMVLWRDTVKNLQGVEITAQKPFLIRSVDKVTINIEGSVYQKGENALRLFNVIPGVRVDPLSGIQFRGGQGVTVYVDNRKIHLSGQPLLDYLRAIPSESIKSYELQAVTGAAYDAQNAGSIININLKNDYKYGFSGSIGSSYQHTRYNEFNENASLNYRVGKLTLQANYAWYKGNQFQDNEEVQHYTASDVLNIQTNQWTSQVKFNSGKFGFDYKINDHEVIGGNYDFNAANFSSGNDANSVFTTHFKGNRVDSTLYTLNKGSNKWGNQMANIFYRNRLDSAGSKLDIGYSYIGYHNSVGNNITNNYYDGEKNSTHPSDSLNTSNPLDVDIHVVSIDLEKRFRKNIILNTGAKYTHSGTNNSILYNNGLSGSLPGFDLRSNTFIYKENILALYASLSIDWRKWSLKPGLRTERYKYTGYSQTTGEEIGRDKWDFFPSLFLQRKFNENHVLTLSSARRISRPDYRQLNPFVEVSNPYFIEQGNPFLRPYFSVSTELEYQLNGKYSFTTGYQQTNKAINTVYKRAGVVIISTDENINNNNNAFLSVNIPIKITGWWEISSSFTARYTTIAIMETTPRRTSKLSQDVWISSKMTLPGKYYLEVTGLYARNNFIGIYDLNPQGRIDMNVKKSFLKDKLTALLNIGDPFNLYKIGWTVHETDFTRQTSRRIATRYISIGLTYSFSSGKKQTDRENVDASGNDARNRL